MSVCQIQRLLRFHKHMVFFGKGILLIINNFCETIGQYYPLSYSFGYFFFMRTYYPAGEPLLFG
jgi:hypothetical protein